MLSYQTLFSLAATVAGFVSALSFFVGNVFNTIENITLQATPFWDFNEHLAKSLASQKAQYLTGGGFLLISFAFQLCSVIPLPISSTQFSPPFNSWLILIAGIAFPFGALAYVINAQLEKFLTSKVFMLNATYQDDCKTG